MFTQVWSNKKPFFYLIHQVICQSSSSDNEACTEKFLKKQTKNNGPNLAPTHARRRYSHASLESACFWTYLSLCVRAPACTWTRCHAYIHLIKQPFQNMICTMLLQRDSFTTKTNAKTTQTSTHTHSHQMGLYRMQPSSLVCMCAYICVFACVSVCALEPALFALLISSAAISKLGAADTARLA